MKHVYYLLFDIQTSAPVAVAGSKFQQVPAGQLMCKVNEEDGEAFILGYKKFHQYIVQVNDEGFAEFKIKGSWTDGLIKSCFDTEIVRDLNQNDAFFDYLRIRVDQVENQISLVGNKKIIEFINSYFNINDLKNCIFYVTLHQNLNGLIQTLDFDLTKFNQNLTYNFQIGTKEKISIWAARI